MSIIKFDEYFLSEESANESIKFTKSSAGMIPVGKKTELKTDVKLKKSDWDALFTKINNLPSAKRSELIKKIHQLGLI